MRGFFEPESVAVVGVSNSLDNLGWLISANLQTFGYRGTVYEVGPKGGSVFGRPIYRSLSDIPGPVDLAVFLTPAPVVPDLLEECGRLGIRRAVIESGGFQEFGEEGRKLSDRLLEVAARHGIRFIGPNCLGLFNCLTGLATAFGPLEPAVEVGGISVLAQSGGVMISILNALTSEGLGVAKLVSMGNKLDVDENDLLEYLIEDPDTQAISLYLEGVVDGRRLMRLARLTDKPILVLKSNRGAAARRIAASHTAALAIDDRVVDAAFRQVGIRRVAGLAELVHHLKALSLPPMRGSRVAVLSRSGGHAVIAADECELNGLELVELPQDFLDRAQRRLRANVIRLTNPMDLGDVFDLDVYRDLAEATLAMEQVDGMVFMHTYVSGPEGSGSEVFFRRLHELSVKADKPVAVHPDTSSEEVSRLKRVLPGPVFDDPSEAVQALALRRDFRRGVVPDGERPEGTAGRAVVEQVLARGRAAGRQLLLPEALAAAAAYGIPIPAGSMAMDEAQAVAIAGEVGFPVALKVVGPELLHKSDVGGIRLDLGDEAAVRVAYRELLTTVAGRAPGAAIDGVLVQSLASAGRDMIIGARRDPDFGHVVLVGLGGILVEVLGDVALRVAPFGPATAEAMLRELRGFPVLAGVRGEAPADLPALVGAIGAITRLVSDFPEIGEIDLNPVRVGAEGAGCMALDARMLLDLPPSD
jgi:acyl-CoA synthetase (NDP forming)